MKRIVIFGTTGGGKTTLAHEIAARRGVPVVDLDELHWLPGWQVTPDDAFAQKIVAATAGDSWVVAGNYTRMRPVFWPKADTVIWLDYPFYVHFFRLVRRTFARVKDRQTICNGNTETWRQTLSKDSIILWLFKTYWKNRRKNLKIIQGGDGAYPHLNYIHLRHPRATRAFLDKHFPKE